MRRIVLPLFAALVLQQCGNGDSPPPPPPPSSSIATTTMTAGSWLFQNSYNMPANPTQIDGYSWRFEFPTQNGVHYLVHPVSGRIAGTAMSVTARVERVGQLQEVEPCGTNNPLMRLYFQRRGDDWSAAKEFYRWWSVKTFALNNGASTQVQVLMDASQWTQVFGKNGRDYPSEWIAAMSDVQAVGMTFGGCFAGHGVYVSGGSAAFIATEFSIR